MYTTDRFEKVFHTRFKTLGFVQLDPRTWQFVILDDPNHPSQVGTHYASKAELLADLTRYATEYGLSE